MINVILYLVALMNLLCSIYAFYLNKTGLGWIFMVTTLGVVLGYAGWHEFRAFQMQLKNALALDDMVELMSLINGAPPRFLTEDANGRYLWEWSFIEDVENPDKYGVQQVYGFENGKLKTRAVAGRVWLDKDPSTVRLVNVDEPSTDSMRRLNAIELEHIAAEEKFIGEDKQ